MSFSLTECLDAQGRVSVKVTPKSSLNRIEGWEEDAEGRRRLKVRVTAPPEDGKANKALLRTLSRHWKVPVSRLHVVTGETSRYKLLQYRGG